MYKIKQIMPSLYHFEFKQKHDLFLSVMMVQEFYESQDKKIKGKKFTLEDMIVAYSKMNEDGDFSYFLDWNAFNFPDMAVKKYLKLNRDTLMIRETTTLNEMEKIIGAEDTTPNPKVYFIATYTEKNKHAGRDLKHEIAHGLYYTNSMYRRVMDELLWTYRDLVSKIYVALSELNYCDDVLADEAQAYLSTSDIRELRGFGFPNIPEDIISSFREIFKSFTDNTRRKRGKKIK